MHRGLLAAALTLSFFTLAGRALAQEGGGPPMKPEAKAHLDAGSRYFRVEEFDKAIAEFKAGYLIDPQPNFLYAIGQAQRLQGNCKEAIVSYHQFLAAEQQTEATSGAAPAAEQAIIKNAQDMIDQCQQQVAAAQRAAAAAAAAAARRAAASAPTAAPASSPVVPLRAVPPPPPRPWWQDRLGLGLAGAGVVVAVTGGVVLLASSSLSNQGSLTLSQFNSRYKQYWTDSEIGVGCLVGGSALALAGAGRLLWEYTKGQDNEPSDMDNAVSSTRITVGPLGLSLQGAF